MIPAIAPLFAAILPFVLFPIEILLPYPYIIEEIAKGALIFFVLQVEDKKTKIYAAIAIGVLFAFSESVLYFFNIFASGNLTSLLLRLATSIPLHTITTLIILLPTLKSKKLLPLGVLSAMLVHYVFNLVVSN